MTHHFLSRALPILVLGLAACGGEKASTPTPNDGSVADGSVADGSVADGSQAGDVGTPQATPTNPAAAKSMLRNDGSFAIFRPKANSLVFASTGGDTAAPAEGEWVQLSAPILPKVLRLYQGQGDNYPKTFAEQAKLADESALTFDELEQACLDFSPEYTSRTASDDAKIAAKYWVLEQCAYARFTAKPYWIPQLLLDVDVCERSLGQGYRTLTEADVRAFLPGEVEAFKRRREEVNRSGGSFYFSMRVWVRSNAGTMASVVLSDGPSAVIEPLMFPQPGWTALNHYEGGLALRCIRVGASLD